MFWKLVIKSVSCFICIWNIQYFRMYMTLNVFLCVNQTTPNTTWKRSGRPKKKKKNAIVQLLFSFSLPSVLPLSSSWALLLRGDLWTGFQPQSLTAGLWSAASAQESRLHRCLSAFTCTLEPTSLTAVCVCVYRWGFTCNPTTLENLFFFFFFLLRFWHFGTHLKQMDFIVWSQCRLER